MEDLAARLKAAAYREGEFTLRSGRKSSYYVDKYAFETRPDLLRDIAVELARMLPEGVVRLGGVELGAVPLVTALAIQTDLPFVIVRKAAKGYGTDKAYEGELVAGERLALIEDVCTTGGAAIKAVETLRAAGIDDLTVIAVLDRQEGAADAFRAAGVPFRALFTRESLGIKGD